MYRALPVVAVLLLASCAKPVEPVSYGRYLIDNRDSTALHVAATGHHGPITLLADSVPANTTTLILEVTEGSGGHVLPSNFLHTLVITTTDSLGNTVQVYSGVHDADWQSTTTSEHHQDLRLLVQ